MSGIFRNSSHNSNTNESTPNKRISFSAFCTSPGTLQDVTMDNSYGVGYRSPCVSLQQYQGSTSPAAQGRSVREFEEQMATLRKENFNLKLRLYFIEESIPGYQQTNSSEGQETLMKQLIDTKVEMEILRKEIQEKQEILKDAAQAMNQMEKIQKETETKSQVMVDELKQKIQYLEMERDMEKSTSNGEFMNDLLGRSDISENLNALQRIRELEGMVKQSEEKINDFQNQITTLDEYLLKRDETIKEYEEKVKELVFQNAELLEVLENREKEVANAEAQRLREELQEHKSQLADKTCMLQEADEKLKNRAQIHEQACRTIQKLMLNIKSQQLEINKLKSQQTNTSAVGNKENSHGSAVNLTGLECTGLCRSLSDSEALNELSGIKKVKMETIIEQQQATIHDLKAEVKKKTANLQNLVNKELWEKNREIERLTKVVNMNNVAASPLSPPPTSDISELQQSFSDVEYAKALERNKLLQRKVDILIKRLGVDRHNEALVAQLRNEVHNARTDAEQAEKWRHECADVCSILSNRLEELAGFLNSLLKHKDVLGILAVDRRRAIRKAVDRSLDLSKSLNMTLSVSGLSMGDHSLAQLSNLSDLLVDAEGAENRTFNSHEELHVQSIEKLKAENKALKKELDKRRCADNKKDRRSLPLPLENQSESEAWSEPDRKVSMARIGLEDHSASTKELTPQLALVETDSESDALNQSRSAKTRTQERIGQLEQMIAQRDDRILEIQCQLVDADNRLKKENLRMIDVNHELEQLRLRNEELHADLIAIGSTQEPSQASFDESLLRRQIDEQTRSLEEMQEECNQLRLKHAVELQLASDQESHKLEQQQRDMELLMQQRLSEQERLHSAKLSRDWCERSVYEETKQQLLELQRQYTESQRTIDYLNENEQELKQTLVESELSARALKKQLDESTLQASRAVLERTKALNEKLQLEKRVQELQQQLGAQESERNSLQRQVTQLESVQQALQEQIAHSQTRLNGSDVSQSGYTSEEVPVAAAQSGAVAHQRAAAVGMQRQNNSSPDLGIESDAGRVSSVELSNAQRPLLKTVEMSAGNDQEIKIEADNKPSNMQPQAGLTSAPHDCAKVELENAELRRKLIRTKRAFEDTYEKLRVANQRKAQIEKDIKNQILKTHNVLKNVRSNMENEL